VHYEIVCSLNGCPLLAHSLLTTLGNDSFSQNHTRLKSSLGAKGLMCIEIFYTLTQTKNNLPKIIEITFYSLIFEDVLRSPPFNVA